MTTKVLPPTASSQERFFSRNFFILAFSFFSPELQTIRPQRQAVSSRAVSSEQREPGV